MLFANSWLNFFFMTCNFLSHVCHVVCDKKKIGKWPPKASERIRYFFTCVLYRQSAAYTALAFRATRPGWWMSSKAFTILNPCLFFRLFLRLWLLKQRIIRTAYRKRRSNFLEEKENKNTKSSFGNSISRGWERKSTTGIFATGHFWLCAWKISSVARDKVGNISLILCDHY